MKNNIIPKPKLKLNPDLKKQSKNSYKGGVEINSSWEFLLNLPVDVARNIVSKWTIGHGPDYDDTLAVWIITTINFFPSCWNLDTYLYPLLQKNPKKLSNKLNLSIHNQFKITRQPNEGYVSLIKAIENDEVECVRGLLSAGVDVNSKDRTRKTPLCWASFHRKPDCIKVILTFPEVDVNSGCTSDWTALHTAAFNDDDESIKLLLADPKINVNAKALDDSRNTPLHIAAKFGKTNSVETLLKDERVDVNAKNRFDDTPLDVAKTNNIANKNDNAIKIFEKFNIDKTNNTNKTSETEKTGGANYIMYKGKKYKTHIGKKGGKYILVGKDKKKVYISKKVVENQANPMTITEDMAQKMIKAKEERDVSLFYKLAEVEPEEETLEQKIQRNKKELLDNRIR